MAQYQSDENNMGISKDFPDCHNWQKCIENILSQDPAVINALLENLRFRLQSTRETGITVMSIPVFCVFPVLIPVALVLGIPTGGTYFPSDMSVGIHKTLGYSYHCDANVFKKIPF